MKIVIDPSRDNLVWNVIKEMQNFSLCEDRISSDSYPQEGEAKLSVICEQGDSSAMNLK